MIQLTREDRLAVWLRIDHRGLDCLLAAIKKTSDGHVSYVDALVDMSVVSMKRRSALVDAVIEIRPGAQSLLVRTATGIEWTMDGDDLESAMSALNQCKEKGYFFPAEFLQTQVAKNRNLDWIYAELSETVG